MLILFTDFKVVAVVGVTDFINRIVQVLKKNLEKLVINTQNTGLIKLVKL